MATDLGFMKSVFSHQMILMRQLLQIGRLSISDQLEWYVLLPKGGHIRKVTNMLNLQTK